MNELGRETIHAIGMAMIWFDFPVTMEIVAKETGVDISAVESVLDEMMVDGSVQKYEYFRNANSEPATFYMLHEELQNELRDVLTPKRRRNRAERRRDAHRRKHGKDWR